VQHPLLNVEHANDEQALSGSLVAAGVLGVLFDLESQFQLVHSLRYFVVCAP